MMKKKLNLTQGGWHLRRVLLVLPWAAVFSGGGYAAIRCALGYFTGEGTPLPDLLVFLLGLVTTALAAGAAVSLYCLAARLYALLTWKRRLRESLRPYVERDNQRYLPPEPVKDPLQVVLKEFSCAEKELPWVKFGKNWLLLPGQGMEIDAVVGLYFEEHSWDPRSRPREESLCLDPESGYIVAKITRRTHARRSRITLVDEDGRRAVWEVPAKEAAAWYATLCFCCPWASTGDQRLLNRFLREEGKHPNYHKLRTSTAPSVLVSPWDHTAILEDNQGVCPYERWLMTAYAPYLKDRLSAVRFDGDPFSYAAGTPCTFHERLLSRASLMISFEVQDKDQLLRVARRFLEEGQKRTGAWELSRGLMMLGFGYLAGYLSRKELLEISLPLAKAIQAFFPGWEVFHDGYMEVFGQKYPKDYDQRRKVYQELKADPASVLNTAPFDMDLEEQYQAALDAVQAMADHPREKENKG